jgi:hypothetical protein
VDAWRALFSSLKNVQIGTETTPANLTAPFSRTLTPAGTSTNSANGTSINAWTGFRSLSATEVTALAEEMVMQVRKRGPFLSMADFVNRKVVAAGSDTSYKLGVSGALQAALDASVNLVSNIDNTTAGDVHKFRDPSTLQTSSAGTPPNTPYLADTDYILPTRLAGFPGWVMQGDVLSPLAPTLAARSDTFIIRTYGDAQTPPPPKLKPRRGAKPSCSDCPII